MTPESEVYRFGNGGLLTSTERVTVPVVLADHPLSLSYSVVESPVLSLLSGRDVVEGLGLDIKGSEHAHRETATARPLNTFLVQGAVRDGRWAGQGKGRWRRHG